MTSPQHWYRLFFLLFALVLIAPFTGIFVQSPGLAAVAAAQGSLTLVAPASQPQGGSALVGTAVPTVAFAVTNSGTTDGVVTGITLHKTGTLPDTALGTIGVVDTTANYLAAEVNTTSFSASTHNTNISFPLALHLAPGQTHTFVVWASVPKATATANIGKTFSLTLNALTTPATVAGPLPFVGATYTLATNTVAPAPTCYMSLSPGTIPVGGSITIRWSSRNAETANITSIGSVSTSGTLNTLPTSAAQTTFTGTFVGPGGTAHCSASVSVVAVNGAGGGGGSNFNPADYSASVTPLTVPTALPIPTVTPPTSNFNTTPAPTVSAPLQQGTLASSLVPARCIFSASGGSDYTNLNNAVAATSCDICDFGQLIQNIINYLILITIPLSAGLFGYAGALYFTARGNPTQIGKAHKIFTSVVIGFVIAISGYLIVQTVLNTLLKQDFYGSGFSWTKLDCSVVRGNVAARPRTATIGSIFGSLYGQNSTYNTTTAAAQAPLSSNSSGACDPSVVSSAAAAGGTTLTSQEASFFACVAKPESACGTNITGAKGANGVPSSAVGAFQFVVSTNAQYLDNSACVQAAKTANYNVSSGSLQGCKSAVNQGRPAGRYAGMSPSDPENLGQACIAAAANLSCQTVASAALLRANPSGSDWAGASDGLSHAGQQACTGLLR